MVASVGSAKAAIAGGGNGGVDNGDSEARTLCGSSPLNLICETQPFQKNQHDHTIIHSSEHARIIASIHPTSDSTSMSIRYLVRQTQDRASLQNNRKKKKQKPKTFTISKMSKPTSSGSIRKGRIRIHFSK